jgi:tRNA dimethylallyltransferase
LVGDKWYFAKQNVMKVPVISIVGPTTSGKSFVAHTLALRIMNDLKIPSEIISCDSVQVYKYFDIGTDKVPLSQRKEVTYHLIDILEPNEGRFSAGQFRKSFDEIVEGINSRSSVAIMVGGTGLYYKSVRVGFAEAPEANNEIRNELTRLAKEKGTDFIYDMLKKVDEIYASKISKNDLKRIIRALEVFRLTGKQFSEIHSFSVPSRHKIYSFLMLPERRLLYERINERVDKMIEKGLIDEVKWIIQNYGTDIYPLQSIGYKEMVEFLRGSISLTQAIELIKRNTKNFAKRQITLFRYTPIDEVVYLNEISEETLVEVVEKIFEKVCEFLNC